LERRSPSGFELLLLPCVVDLAFVEPVRVFDRPYLLTYNVVVRLHGDPAPPRSHGLVSLAIAIQG